MDIFNPEEEAAYKKHLEVRELEDTAANRATWTAALDYAVGLEFFKATDDDKIESGISAEYQEAEVVRTNLEVRSHALAASINLRGYGRDASAEATVTDAKVIETFLRGGDA